MALWVKSFRDVVQNSQLGLISMGNALFLIGDPTKYFRALKGSESLFTWSLLSITEPDWGNSASFIQRRLGGRLIRVAPETDNPPFPRVPGLSEEDMAPFFRQALATPSVLSVCEPQWGPASLPL